MSFFAGYGSQSLALKYLGIPYENHCICEWAIPSIQAYKDIHYPNDNTDYSSKYDVETLTNILWQLGISSDYNNPMELKNIQKKPESWKRQVFNNIKATRNLVNISKVTAKSLHITEQEKFTYLLTYSFPCQDISLAGKLKGFSDTSTRSGLLWEVARILQDLHNSGIHLDVLLMENVTQVHSTKNMPDFQRWLDFLKSIGYSNYYQDLNAKDYAIPQNRNRCFMVSIYDPNHKQYFDFPKKMKLNILLENVLEDNVDDSYFLSDRIVTFYENNSLEQERKGNGFRFEPRERERAKLASTITCRAGNRMDDNFIIENDIRTNCSVEKSSQPFRKCTR